MAKSYSEDVIVLMRLSVVEEQLINRIDLKSQICKIEIDELAGTSRSRMSRRAKIRMKSAS